MSRRFIGFAALLLAGCGTTLDPDYVAEVQLANEYYKNGKFEEAMRKYEDAIEKFPNGYEAIVGLGCADREWGFRKFIEAEDLFRARKVELAKTEFQKASGYHDKAQKLFHRAIQLRPDDLLAHRELGHFYYKRATSPYSYPYRLDDQENRRAELDRAIEKFTMIVEKVPNEYFAQRYLGLALFAKGDSPKGRRHLEVYLWGMATARKYIIKSSSGNNSEEREDAEKRLREIDRELAGVRDVLEGYVLDLKRRKTEAKEVIEASENELESATDPERVNELKGIVAEARKGFEVFSVEILAVESLISKYKEVEATKAPEKSSQ